MEALLAGIQANSFILLMTGIGAVLFILFQKIEKVETRLFMETKELKNDVVGLFKEVLKVKNEFTEVKNEFTEVKNEFTEVKNEFRAVKNEFTEIKNELRELTSVVKLLNKKD